MCGQLGWVIPEPSVNSIAMGAIMTVGMDRRGGHSWGYWADGKIYKGLGDMHAGVPGSKFGQYRRLIGHTRLATTGARTAENSHPFTQGRIIGAHNGQVYNHDDLQKKYKRDFQVDSQHIFQHINDGLPLNDIDAYGSIVWLDTETDLINLGRFHNGSMWAAKIYDSVDKKALPIGFAWCSTSECLSEALNSAGWTHWNSFELKEGHSYWISEEDHELYYNTKKDLNFGYFVKPNKTVYKDYSYGSSYSTNPKAASPSGVGASGSIDNSSVVDIGLLKRFDNVSYKSLCDNCREQEKCVKHDQYGVKLCYTCHLEIDDAMENIDEQIFVGAFQPKDNQLTMPV